MESNKKYLLSTRPLPKAIHEEGLTKNIIIEELSFIDTKPIEDEELYNKIKALSAERHTVIFTSMNAVEAVSAQIQEAPDWQIYSIGNTTRKLIEEKWGAEKIVATAENAQRLGERLIDDSVKEVIFFCGNIRREELPNRMRSERRKVEEVVVYETKETPTQLTREYDGILFFSPSAVDAFYNQNKPSKSTILFAIGKTTEEALRQHKSHKIVVAHITDKIEMAKEAIDYLSQATNS
jgi:uroporphyrinogen-III synthase